MSVTRAAVMAGVDAALARFPWLDADRMVALGASFGGFMINWINGHTDRFKCLVEHDGIFNTHGMLYTTEELWFMEVCGCRFAAAMIFAFCCFEAWSADKHDLRILVWLCSGSLAGFRMIISARCMRSGTRRGS